MEGYKQKGAGLPRAVGSALDNGVRPEAGSGDLLKHAACSVHDKYQCRDMFHTEEPANKDVCKKICPKYTLLKIEKL